MKKIERKEVKIELEVDIHPFYGRNPELFVQEFQAAMKAVMDKGFTAQQLEFCHMGGYDYSGIGVRGVRPETDEELLERRQKALESERQRLVRKQAKLDQDKQALENAYCE
jgi:hypothetical protein